MPPQAGLLRYAASCCACASCAASGASCACGCAARRRGEAGGKGGKGGKARWKAMQDGNFRNFVGFVYPEKTYKTWYNMMVFINQQTVWFNLFDHKTWQVKQRKKKPNIKKKEVKHWFGEISFQHGLGFLLTPNGPRFFFLEFTIGFPTCPTGCCREFSGNDP